MSSASIIVPKSVAKRVREEAEKLGISAEEYLLELVTQGLDPSNRAIGYIEVAKELLEQAKEGLEKDDVSQAAKRVWGAAALAVKAYAEWKDGKRLASHGDLWEYKRKMVKELGEWVNDSWAQANAMHICLYEGWCAREDIEEAIERIEKLLKETTSRTKE